MKFSIHHTKSFDSPFFCKQCQSFHVAKPEHDAICWISCEIQFLLRCLEKRALVCVQHFDDGKCILWAYKVHWQDGCQHMTLTKTHDPPKELNWMDQVLRLAAFDNHSVVQTPPTQTQKGWNTSNWTYKENWLINTINWWESDVKVIREEWIDNVFYEMYTLAIPSKMPLLISAHDFD